LGKGEGGRGGELEQQPPVWERGRGRKRWLYKSLKGNETGEKRGTKWAAIHHIIAKEPACRTEEKNTHT